MPLYPRSHKMNNLVTWFVLVALLLKLVTASDGDREDEFHECIDKCKCPANESTRTLLWTCMDTCEYDCMWKRTTERKAQNFPSCNTLVNGHSNLFWVCKNLLRSWLVLAIWWLIDGYPSLQSIQCHVYGKLLSNQCCFGCNCLDICNGVSFKG